MPIERLICEFDHRYLIPMLRGDKSLNDERFREIYFKKRDIFERIHPSGALPSATLLDIVEQFEAVVARDAAAIARAAAEAAPKPATKKSEKATA